MFEALVETAFTMNPTVKIVCCSLYGADLQKIISDPIPQNPIPQNPVGLVVHVPAEAPRQVVDMAGSDADVKVDTPRHLHQDLTEAFILKINKTLLDLNARFGVHMPYLDRLCHRYNPKNGYRHIYKDLLEGHLPSLDMKIKCACLIAASLNKDSANW